MKTTQNPNKPALNIDRLAAAMNRYLVPAAQAQPKRRCAIGQELSPQARKNLARLMAKQIPKYEARDRQAETRVPSLDQFPEDVQHVVYDLIAGALLRWEDEQQKSSEY